MQARACEQVAQSILWHKKVPTHNPHFERAITHLENALNNVKKQYFLIHQIIAPLYKFITKLTGHRCFVKSIGTEQYQISLMTKKKKLSYLMKGLLGVARYRAKNKRSLNTKNQLYLDMQYECHLSYV